MNLSKSKYVEYCNCPKLAWLHECKPELMEKTANNHADEGKEVGDLARGYFGKYINVLTLDENGNLDYNAMISKTKECIKNGTENICEASFSANGCYCQVDILHKVDGGYEIYEVKSATKIKPANENDVAFQKYVLEKSGINVVNTYLITLNSDYIRQGELDIKQLFKLTNMKDVVDEKYVDIENNIERAKQVLSSDIEPKCDISSVCGISGSPCGFKGYCLKRIPKPSVLDIYGFRKKYKCLKEGIITFEDVIKNNIKLKDIQKRQVETYLYDLPIYLDKENVKKFLDTLTYPLYFLDFETYQTAIPQYDGMWAYEQVPFQYSLHYKESKNGDIKHKEFLAKEGTDPRRQIAESLVKDIPTNACVVAYNGAFEIDRLLELSNIFDDLSEPLYKIAMNVVDPLEVFQKGYVYNKAMGGSFSIKSVLPALFPDDSRMDYHNLNNVHNGTEATQTFLKLSSMSKEQREEYRQCLLEYCKLDTLAMVLVVSKLYEFIE